MPSRKLLQNVEHFTEETACKQIRFEMQFKKNMCFTQKTMTSFSIQWLILQIQQVLKLYGRNYWYEKIIDHKHSFFSNDLGGGNFIHVRSSSISAQNWLSKQLVKNR